MRAENTMRLSFPSRSMNEAFARAAVSAFAASADPTLDLLCDVKTAVSEAVTNAIVHGYRDTMGEVHLSAWLTASGKLTIRVSDKGCGIPDISKAMEPLYTTCPGEERAGLGFAVMQELMDSVKVSSKVGRGTTVTMVKQLIPKRARAAEPKISVLAPESSLPQS